MISKYPAIQCNPPNVVSFHETIPLIFYINFSSPRDKAGLPADEGADAGQAEAPQAGNRFAPVGGGTGNEGAAIAPPAVVVVHFFLRQKCAQAFFVMKLVKIG
jgi:hypothetical protein